MASVAGLRPSEHSLDSRKPKSLPKEFNSWLYCEGSYIGNLRRTVLLREGSAILTKWDVHQSISQKEACTIWTPHSKI